MAQLLPLQLTKFIGRERERSAVSGLLHHPDVRLLTLTGTGGIGKTRLGIAIANDLLADYTDGVYFVNLAPLSDPALVIPTIAQALQIKEGADRPLLDLVKAFLREKQLLLLLDNFEQIISAAVQVLELLVSCPQLNVLVTSRAALHVSGEQEFAVPPLAIPNPTCLPDLAALSQYEAVALFLQRAQALKPEFQLTSATAPAVVAICIQLDGLPLAIELAATRIKLFPPQALLTRLSQRLSVLTNGARDAPARQQTLRDTIAWSYNLLNEREQRIFRRLSVFVGGCTLQAVEAVCAALEDGSGEEWVLDGVASLLDKSLLQQTTQEGEEPRLMILETIREYGLECLTVNGEMEAIQQAHAAYYLLLAEEAKPQFQGPQQDRWLERLEREHENVRKVLSWLIGREEIEMALRLATALTRFWEVHGHLNEGYQWLERALSSSEDVAVPLRAWGLNDAGWLACLQNKPDQAERLLGESLSLFRAVDDKRGIALSLRREGFVAWTRGKYAVACSLAQEALLLFQALDDRRGAAHVCLLLAYIAIEQGEYVKARSLLEECLSVFRESGDKRRMAVVSVHLARVLFAQGDPLRAHALVEEGLAGSMSLGDKENSALGLSLSGQIALYQNDTATAHSLLTQSLTLSRRYRGAQVLTAEVLSLLARAVTMQGDYAAARALFEESLALCGEGGKRSQPACLEGLAGLFWYQGERAWAVQLWGMSAALREAISVPMPPIERASYESSLAAACTQLGKKAFAAAWEEGRNMTPEQAHAVRDLSVQLQASSKGSLSLPSAKPSPRYPDGLTTREGEVLHLVAQGLTNLQVAEKLVISPSTVNTHLKAIYGKIGVSSRSAATRYAMEHRLL